MNNTTRIVAAGNTLAPALAEVVAAGYKVIRPEACTEWQATRGEVVLIADDPLMLLGLVRLYEARGENWPPSDQEVEAFLALDACGAESVKESVAAHSTTGNRPLPDAGPIGEDSAHGRPQSRHP
jgi:hypothetical protein